MKLLLMTIVLQIGTLNRSSNENIFSVKTILGKIYRWIRNYNLFEHSYTDEFTQRNEILSTRLYVLFMIIGFIAIVFYASIVQHIVIYHVESPPINTYRQLAKQYPSLTCECQQPTTSYSVFVSFSPTFHQLCSSIYAQSGFTVRYGNTSGTFLLGRFGFSTTMTALAVGISAFCNIGKQIVSESTMAYLEKTYLSTYLTHEDEFISTMNLSVNNFKTSLLAAVRHFFELLRYTTQGNQLLSSVFSNAKMLYNTSSTAAENKIKILWSNSLNESCNCGLSSDSCAVFYDDYCNHTYTYQFTDECPAPAKGIAIACYGFDTALLTTLECFFDPFCVSMM